MKVQNIHKLFFALKTIIIIIHDFLCLVNLNLSLVTEQFFLLK